MVEQGICLKHIYTKNQLMFWLDGKINNYGTDIIDLNAIVTIKIYILNN
jgi:hypothetical protein